MEYIYSALVLHSAGKDITEDAITNVLKAAGVEVDEARVKALTASLEGVDIEKAMSTPVAAAAPAPAEVADSGDKAEKKEEKKKEKKEEVSEEDAAAGLGALFG